MYRKYLIKRSIEPDEIEFNIDAIERFTKKKLDSFGEAEIKIIRVLNLVCCIFPPKSFPLMLFMNFFDNEDNTYEFIRDYHENGLEEYAKEIFRVFHEVRNDYTESEGLVEFLDADKDLSDDDWFNLSIFLK